jgi:hypothetical protein
MQSGMKYALIFTVVFVMASCSSPQYTYRFAPSKGDKQESASVRTPVQRIAEKEVVIASVEVPSEVIAYDDGKPGKITEKISRKLTKLGEQVVRKTGMIPTTAPGDLDMDLKYSVIFAAAGIVSLLLLILSKIFGIIGGIALIAATIFFVKWVLKQ